MNRLYQIPFFAGFISLIFSSANCLKAINQSNCKAPQSEQIAIPVNDELFVQHWVRDASAEQVVQTFNRLFLLSPAEAQQIPCLPPLGDWSGNRISSAFGRRQHPILHTVRHHDGIDIAGPQQSVRSAASGRVAAVGYSVSLGSYVKVDHGNSYKTVYGHLALTSVQSGQSISIGETLGITGRSGRATGVHLHYSVLKHGVAVNPAHYLTLAIRFVEFYQKHPQSNPNT